MTNATFKFGTGTPPRILHVSVWHPIHSHIRDAKKGVWNFVELPAGKLKKALDSVRQHIRINKMDVELRVDKSKVDKGVGVIWYRKNGEQKSATSSPDMTAEISIRGKAHKVVKLVEDSVVPFPIVYVEESA